MKDKEKQIEEMAKVMYGYICKDRPCKECNYHGKSKILKPYCEYYLKAQDLYEQGYRKCKDSVVLSREQLAKYSEMYDKGWETYKQGEHNAEVWFQNIEIPKVKEKERKETAEKFVKEVDDCMQSSDLSRIMAYRIKELAKQFGVEIKE